MGSSWIKLRVKSWINWAINRTKPDLKYEIVMEGWKTRSQVTSLLNWYSDLLGKIEPELQNNFEMDALRLQERINSWINWFVDFIWETELEIQNQRPESSTVFISFRRFGENIRRREEYFWNLFNHVIRLLGENHCSDVIFISEVFRCALIYASNYFSPDHLIIDNPQEEFYFNNIRQIRMNFVTRLMIAPYRNGNLQSVFRYDPIQWAILNGKYKLLRELLQYGVMYIAMDDNILTWMECSSLIHWLSTGEGRDMILNGLVMISNFQSLNPESRQRMLAVYKAVEVLFYRWFTDLHMLCFRTAFETIPEPFITSKEIKIFLERCFTVPLPDDFFREKISRYETFFPESLQPRTPRSLQHLSLCQVRQNLRQVGQFPHGIRHLRIPRLLKEYIGKIPLLKY